MRIIRDLALAVFFTFIVFFLNKQVSAIVQLLKHLYHACLQFFFQFFPSFSASHLIIPTLVVVFIPFIIALLISTLFGRWNRHKNEIFHFTFWMLWILILSILI